MSDNETDNEDVGTPLRGWGIVAEEVLERIVIVSPHLDDAVLGCSQLMAAHPGATVVTVFSGPLEQYPDPMTHWDQIAGFVPGDDVLVARRKEDAGALAELGARWVWLDFTEHQYLERPEWVQAPAIVDTLEQTIRDLNPTAVFIPFGLANPDHDVTHLAAMLVRDRFGSVPWFCYEDSGYKHIPGMLAWRVSQLFRKGIWPTPACPRVDPGQERKRAAFAHYTSQILALDHDWAILAKLDTPAPEQFWRLDPPPQGWGGLLQQDD